MFNLLHFATCAIEHAYEPGGDLKKEAYALDMLDRVKVVQSFIFGYTHVNSKILYTRLPLTFAVYHLEPPDVSVLEIPAALNHLEDSSNFSFWTIGKQRIKDKTLVC